MGPVAPTEGPLQLDLLLDRALTAARDLVSQRRTIPAEHQTPASALVPPELTGRTGHPVDERAMLYALGAVLYELATGRPPFEQRDPLRLVHEQLTRAPVAPIVLRPELPKALSDILLHLLEMEPGRRYHGPEGLIHDLERVRSALSAGRAAVFKPGSRDFPPQLSAPSSPVGRAPEIAQLRAAMEGVGRGLCRVMLISGPPGVGKTALANEVRAMVAARNGRFVSAKFQPDEQDEPSLILQVLTALGQLLLTEPDHDLATHRERIRHTLGPQAGLVCAVPEFRLLLGELPEAPAVDASHAQERMGRVVLDLVRAIASPERPLVMLLDDLQWGRAGTANFIEDVLAGNGPPGLLVLGAYRDVDVSPLHPLGVAISRWSSRDYPLHFLCLSNLAVDDVARTLEKMLRLGFQRCRQLAQALAPHAAGNPFQTVELVNALRRDGLLTPAARGWRWDERALQRYIGQTGVRDLLEARIQGLPAAARDLLRTLACVRRELSLALARAASGLSDAGLEAQLTILCDEGLMLREAGPPALVRLPHARIGQAAYDLLPDATRAELHLVLARRLASHCAFEQEAAEQYLACAPGALDASEKHRAATLLRSGAARARALGNHPIAHQMLNVALSMLASCGIPTQEHRTLLSACEIDLHVTLCGLGRLQEADAVYERIEAREADAVRLVPTACVQISSLSDRGRTDEATALGLRILRSFGHEVPARHDEPQLVRRFEDLRRWFSDFDVARELGRNECRQPHVVAAAKMFARLFYYADVNLTCWLVLESHSLWERYGPCPALATNLSRVSVLAGAMGQWHTGYAGGRSLLAFCEARGWEAESSIVRHILAVSSMHWFEPLDLVLRETLRAREGLLPAGDLHNAWLNRRAAALLVLECAPTLDSFAEEVGSGMHFAQRTGNSKALATFAADRQLLRSLRGETHHEGCFDDAEFNEVRHLQETASDRRAASSYHVRRAMASAIFGDLKPLLVHARAAMKLMTSQHLYHTAWSYWLLALGISWSLQQSRPGSALLQPEQLDELGLCVDWLERRAADAPPNFGHLLMHVKAERAWAFGDRAEAAKLFESALAAVGAVPRPLHRAFITERAGRFHFAHGRPRQGRQLLSEAAQLYQSWGAGGKAAQLELPNGHAAGTQLVEPRSAARKATADELDSLAVLRATQALSSERSAGRLKARVEEVLGALTGASRVVLALWDEEATDWVLREGDGWGEGEVLPVPAAPHVLPLSAFRYAERTREALLLEDAVSDDRFSRDPYFRGMECCSLMVVPILHHAMTRAILVLENRAARGAFNTARLDAVMMIAGQLAVSLESAQLYERLERKVREQTQQLREAQSRLLAEARQAGMAQIATNVLHNVGNVLNSVNVSAHVLDTRVRQSRAGRVADLARLLQDNEQDLAGFFGAEGKGRLLPGYLHELAEVLESEREELLDELRRMGASVDHIKNVVAMQQSYAGASGVLEPVLITQLVDDALRIQESALERDRVKVTRRYAAVQPAALDRTRVMQVLVNLLDNARQAMQALGGERRLDVAVRQEAGSVSVSVSDSGCGIDRENIKRIFAHGFTTKPGGHGFGLHSCAVAAQEMGGTLTAHSDGPGQGATFTLTMRTTP